MRRSPPAGAIKSIGHSHMECGGKRGATPLWLVFVPYPSQDEPLKPKRRRASLAAALHSPTPAGEVQSFKLAVRDVGTPEAPYTLPRLPPVITLRLCGCWTVICCV